MNYTNKGWSDAPKEVQFEFKSKVVPEALKGQRTISGIASEFSVHPNQISLWKQQLKSALPDIFSHKSRSSTVDNEKLEARLYQEIGRLKIELDWLKKKV